MKKFILFVLFSLMCMSIPVYGSIVGDGYGTIGGGESVTENPPAAPQNPSPPPPIVEPQVQVPVEAEKPQQEKKTKPSEPKNEKDEEVFEEVGQTNEETISKNEIQKAEPPKEIDQDKKEPLEQEEEPKTQKQENIEIIFMPTEEAPVSDPYPDMDKIIRIICIFLTILGSYFTVFSIYAFVFMPRLYLSSYDTFEFYSFLFLRKRDSGYYLRIPPRIVQRITMSKEGKIIFTFVGKKQGQPLEVEVDHEVTEYTIEREVIVYISRKEA